MHVDGEMVYFYWVQQQHQNFIHRLVDATRESNPYYRNELVTLTLTASAEHPAASEFLDGGEFRRAGARAGPAAAAAGAASQGHVGGD